MNKTFVRTNNVKNFIGLVENLINNPKNIPKMGLVYGESGLGKTQTALWLACKYDGIYLRASNLMTGRWLLDGLIKEIDEITLKEVLKNDDADAEEIELANENF